MPALPHRLAKRTAANGVVYYSSPLLEAIGVPHAFSTRLGGVSDGPFASLNLGNPNGCAVQDSKDNIAENYHRLMAAIGCPQRRREWTHQVHGRVIHELACGDGFDTGNAKGDGLVTTDGGRVLSMRVADCVPVLLASGDGKAVAAVHAGWRGAIAGVVTHAVERLRQCAAGSAGQTPGNFTAAIGPCIGYDAFEVGEEVLVQFAALERQLGHAMRHGAAAGAGGPLFRRVGQDKGRVDLRSAVLAQLVTAGVDGDRIDISDRCTWRDGDEFFSHRRDAGLTGRMAALIGPKRPRAITV